MKRRYVMTIAAAAACSAMILAGCGSSNSTSAASASSASSAEETAAASETATGGTTEASTESAEEAVSYDYEVGENIKKIQEAGSLRVGIDASYVPYCFVDPSSGDAYGLNVDIAKRVAEVLGVDCEIIPESFAAVLSDLQTDSIDLCAAMVTNTEERDEVMDFTTPYREGYSYILVRSEDADKYHSMADLAGATITANNGSVQLDYANQVDGATVVACDSTADAVLQVESGTADACVVNDTNGAMFELGYNGELVMDKDISWPDNISSLAVNEGHTDLKNVVDMVTEKEFVPHVDELLDKYTKLGVQMLGVGE